MPENGIILSEVFRRIFPVGPEVFCAGTGEKKKGKNEKTGSGE
jgi:hypothetical protein